jgi:DNA (cytosine-5)-methyltransferase 1
MSESEYFTIRDVAVVLKITEQTVRNLVRSGSIKANKVGKQWVITKNDIEEYIKTGKISIEPGDHPRVSSDIPSIVALSFFSGAMGLDLGMENAGVKAILACEIDKSCRLTIQANRPDIGLIGDVLKYSADDIRKMASISADTDIDVIFGGPPCQAFSTAGNRKGFQDDRGNVFLRYLDIVSDLKPKYVVIENVRGLLSAPYHRDPNDPKSKYVKGGALLHTINKLEKAGYAVSFNLYNSANYGAPQIRERVVIIGCRNGVKAPYLIPTHSKDGEYNLPKWITLGDALEGLDLSDPHFVKFPEDRLKYYRILKAGQYWKNLPVELQKEALGKSYYLGGGKTGFLRRLSFDAPSPTLVTHPAMPATDLGHPIEDRPLCVEEYRRIQGFPDDWKICGNMLDQYRQIGNAVPISLGEAIGKMIIGLMNKSEPVANPNFNYSRYKNTDEMSWMEEMFPELSRKQVSRHQTTLSV